MLTRTKEKEISQHNSSIPNGFLIYTVITNWLHYDFSEITQDTLTDDFKFAVGAELNALALEIMNHHFRMNTVDIPVIFDNSVKLSDDILSISVRYSENDIDFTHTELLIPVNIPKPLGQLYLDWHIEDNITELTNEIDQDITARIMKTIKI